MLNQVFLMKRKNKMIFNEVDFLYNLYVLHTPYFSDDDKLASLSYIRGFNKHVTIKNVSEVAYKSAEKYDVNFLIMPGSHRVDAFHYKNGLIVVYTQFYEQSEFYYFNGINFDEKSISIDVISVIAMLLQEQV